MSEEKRFARRRFFQEGLRELLKPLSKAVEPMERAIRQFESLAAESKEKTPALSSLPSVWLRPPGAIHPDSSFVDTCSRCRKCIEVCPAQCIDIDPNCQRGNGAPYIKPDEMACVVCEGLKCMHTCPTGALSPIPIGEINMGTAVVNHQICVRSRGEDCTICIDTCPIGSVAIELRDAKVHVIEDGCIGCGVCQQQCPTEPKSIIVLSREVWEQRVR
ncbi:MAG TPA: 4Fe-4S dicluster domain-containing protein [Tepidisphaeraceae bacterium]|jgi:ferredoxin-type protein NapG|nr:4Fe-4S dicluster domain-containing protein [Tepidisphaeraceae bacterium]